MQFKLKSVSGLQCAVLIPNSYRLNTLQDALDLMVEVQSLGADSVELSASDICPEFFDLKSGLAGEILQKFVNYAMQIRIRGDFSAFGSRALRDFIRECNSGTAIHFIQDPMP